jgi:hypothetical protein
MAKRLDELAENLASGMSRRKAFLRFFGVAGAVVLAGRASAAGKGNNVCVAFCRAQGLSGDDFGLCVSSSAHCPDGECAVQINGGHFICVPVEGGV